MWDRGEAIIIEATSPQFLDRMFTEVKNEAWLHLACLLLSTKASEGFNVGPSQWAQTP